MNANTIELGAVRTRWTAADDAKLNELIERKKRVMTEARAPLEAITGTWEFRTGEGLTLVDRMIEDADRLIVALQPFTKEPT